MSTPLFRVGFAFFSSSVVALAIACGGGAKEPATSKAPEGAGAAPESTEKTAAAPASASAAPASTDGTTTTTQLGNNGDLQGAKLGSSVHTTTETKGEGGPKSPHGQSSNEAGRGPKDIDTIVKVHRDEARACYDKGLAAHPGIEGDLDVKWVIDPQGNVTDASVDTTKSSILEPSVGACIVDVIKKLKFGPSAKGFETRAHYPFNFHPKTFTPKDAGK
jgi:hypothetical protein